MTKFSVALAALIVAALVLPGCKASPRTTVLAKDEQTALLLVGDLLGGTVELDNGYRLNVTEDVLQKSITNVGIVKDSPDQLRDRVLLRVDPGEARLRFVAADGKVTERNIFVTPGVTKELRLN